MARAAQRARSLTAEGRSLRRSFEKSGEAHWQADKDRQLGDLMSRAVTALREEDQLLARAIGTESSLSKEYSSRGAPGLSYWVFEHNLVYAVFKSWVSDYRVMWDEPARASWMPTEARKRVANDNSLKKPIDLQVVVNSEDDERWLFETQWLNKKAGVKHAAEDADKLKDLVKSSRTSPTRAFLMGIWNHVAVEIDNDLGWVEERDRIDRTRTVHLALFKSKVPAPKPRNVQDGYHCVAVREIIV